MGTLCVVGAVQCYTKDLQCESSWIPTVITWSLAARSTAPDPTRRNFY